MTPSSVRAGGVELGVLGGGGRSSEKAEVEEASGEREAKVHGVQFSQSCVLPARVRVQQSVFVG